MTSRSRRRLEGEAPSRAAAAGRLVDPVELPSVYFGFGQYVLAEPRWKALERHARWLLGHRELTVRLEGVCDSEEYVQEASALLVYRRQLAVKNGLVHLGVHEDRLIVKFEEPSEVAGRMLPGPDGAANRRVDFVETGPLPRPVGPVRR